MVALLVILVILVFILPNPSGSGAFVGNAIDSIITFFRSIGGQVDAVGLQMPWGTSG
ncbi:MAG TPA: hypothetical protein VD903_16430 [Pseudonocardia sp.]|nr:hypothetical protein [Pseudonocardia sp.]